MPKIPTYSRQQQLPESQITQIKDVASANKVERGMHGLGITLQKRGEEMKAQEDAIEAVDAFSAFSDEWNGYVRGELNQKGQSSFGNVERAQTKFEDMKKQYSQKFDRSVYDRIYPQMNNLRQGSLNSLGNHQVHERNRVIESKFNAATETVNQMIINDADLTSVEKALYGDEATPGLFGLIDQLRPGIDNMDEKAKTERAVLNEYLSQLARVNPEEVPRMAKLIGKRLSEEDLDKALASGEMAEALKDMQADPVSFNGSLYKSLSPEQQERLNIQAKTMAYTRMQKENAAADREEKKAEKQVKKLREYNDGVMLQKWMQLRDTDERSRVLNELEELMQVQGVSQGMYKYIVEDKETHDNPLIVSALVDEIESGNDMSDSLDRLLTRGEISASTYNSLNKNISSNNYKQAIIRLKAGMEPSPADTWSADKHIKWEQGYKYFHELIAGGYKPADAVNIVLNGYYAKLRRTQASIPNSPYLDDVDKDDPFAIRNKMRGLADQYKMGVLDEVVYKHEMEVLRLHYQYAVDRHRSRSYVDEMDLGLEKDKERK